jgi:predicted nucleic acid-binding protein
MTWFGNSVVDGLLDTNVVIHSLSDDVRSEECRRFLRAVELGHFRVRLESYVVHELTYSIPRLIKQMKRDEVALFLGNILEWPGIECDRDLLAAAFSRWRRNPALSFVDALLATTALQQDTKVFTKNVRDFADSGVETPDPLPATPTSSSRHS